MLTTFVAMLQLQMDTVIDGLVGAAGGCERLLSTPVPLRCCSICCAESTIDRFNDPMTQ